MIIYKNFIIPHIFKCAGTSIRRSIIKYKPLDLKYVSEHDSTSSIDSDIFSWSKEYQKILVVRHPYSFYVSFYNYSLNMPKINALSTILDREKGKVKSFDQWLDDNLDIPYFFKRNPNKLVSFRLEVINRTGFIKTWFQNKPLTDLQPEDFVGSYYSLLVDKLFFKDGEIFKLESDIENLKKTLDLPNLLVENKGNVKKFELTQEQKDKIYIHDKELFERFNYER